jgi:hypothetical protein
MGGLCLEPVHIVGEGVFLASNTTDAWRGRGHTLYRPHSQQNSHHGLAQAYDRCGAYLISIEDPFYETPSNKVRHNPVEILVKLQI